MWNYLITLTSILVDILLNNLFSLFRYAVFASFIAGMACLVGMDFSAKLIASLAKSFEVCP